MEILFKIVVGIIIIGFIVIIIAILKSASPKAFEKELTKMGNAVVRARSNIINNNEELLKQTANKNADINKDAVRTMAHAVKEGFTGEEFIYCKYCGSAIDADSRFCKSCGKEQ